MNTGPAARRDGTSLAAVGLESPDPAAAARRAESLSPRSCPAAALPRTHRWTRWPPRRHRTLLL
ncbi:hypothetical protein O1M63_37715 [Streptomyces mirabilis]|nr:hypothetical protein [Streptomyces mirabilis]